MRLAAIIPTYGRDEVLLDTVRALLAMDDSPDEIIVVDQSPAHAASVERELELLESTSAVRWLRLSTPSITHAMNVGLCAAESELALFLDDDIRPDSRLIAAHKRAHAERGPVLVAGRVLQPWDEGLPDRDWASARFASVEEREVEGFMGGNFSLRRARALDLGGFDENFIRVAYHFEREFADRWRAAGGRIWFEPLGLIHHLKVASGGTRSFGEHLTTTRPDHAVGAYYYYLRSRGAERAFSPALKRYLGSIATRHHLKRPWYVPVTLWAELRGMLLAWRLYRDGPRLIGTDGVTA